MIRSSRLLLLAALSCSRAPRATPMPTPASASADPLPPKAHASTAPHDGEDPSPLRVLAVGSFGARLHALASGEVLYGHAFSLWKLEPDGALARLLAVDPGNDFETETNPIGAVVGEWPDAAWISLSEGDHRAGHRSRMFRVKGGKLERLPSGGSWLYLDAARWKEGRVVALRATGAVRFEFNSLPWTVDRLEIVKGAPAPLPKLPKGFFAKGLAAFESGELFVAGTRGEIAMAASGAYVLRASGRFEALPGSGDDVRVSAITGRSEREVYVAGDSAGSAYLAAWDGAAWKQEQADIPSIQSLTVAADGALWAVTGDGTGQSGALWKRTPGGAFAPVAMPDLHAARFAAPPPRVVYEGDALKVDDRARLLDDADKDKTPLVPLQVVARGADDVWVLASRDASPFATYLLHTQRAGAALDADAEEARAAAGSRTAKGCRTMFVSLGDASPEALAKVRADSGIEGPIVVARLGDARVLGAYFGASTEGAKAFGDAWRARGFVVTSACARPPIEALVAR